MHVDVVLPCEHERQGSFEVVRWSETAILEGAPAVSAELHGWGLSVSRSGDFQLSAVTLAEVFIPGH